MTIGTAFGILGISPTDDKDAIQHAFALCSRHAHPEENPEGWKELSQAYQVCMAYAKNKSKPGIDQELIFEPPYPEDDEDFKPADTDDSVHSELSGTDDKKDLEAINPDYFDLFQGIRRKQEEIKGIEKQLDVQLDQLEAEKVIKDLSGYSRALEYLSRLTPFVSYDPIPYRVCTIFRSSIKKKKRFPFYRKKMLRLLSSHSETLNQADDVIMSQRSDDGFAGFRTELRTFVFPVMLWVFLLFACIVRFILTPLFTISQPIKLQIPDNAVHYVDYSQDLPTDSYVKTTLTEAHWVGIGFNKKSSRMKSGNIRITIDTYHQYLFLQAMTSEGESVLIPFVATFSSQAVIPQNEMSEFLNSCSKLAKDINQSGNYLLQGKIQTLDYSDPLQPGIPLIFNPVLLGMDEEMRELFTNDQTFSAFIDQDTEDSRKQSDNNTPDNQLFTPDTKGVFILDDPPEEGRILYREKKLYFFLNPIQYLHNSDQTRLIFLNVFQGLVMIPLLIALKKGKIPHVVVR